MSVFIASLSMYQILFTIFLRNVIYIKQCRLKNNLFTLNVADACNLGQLEIRFLRSLFALYAY